MVNYPNMKKTTVHQTKLIDGKLNTRHRGMNLEEDLNLTNKYYLANESSYCWSKRSRGTRVPAHKKPTPIQIVKVDYPKRSAARIVEAYFKTPSTTDYNGIYKGKYLDFEAKETKKQNFPFTNISVHQIEHLKSVIEHQGIAFVIIAFTHLNEVYLVNASYVIDAYYQPDQKSISYQTVKEKGHLIEQGFNPRLDYLKIIDQYYLGGHENDR